LRTILVCDKMPKKTDVITSSYLLLVRSAPPKGGGHMLTTKMRDRTFRTGGADGPRAEPIRVPNFLLQLLAKFTGLTREISL